MGWSEIVKPPFVKSAVFLGGFVRGFFQGTKDELLETFSDAEIIRFDDTTKLLKRCEPWENHLKGDGYEEINQALKRANYVDARSAIDKHSNPTADPSCIDTLKMAIVEVCTKCTTLLREALPPGIKIPK